MRNVTWVVGSVNTEFMRLFLRWLPEEPWPWVKEFVILSDPGWVKRMTDLLRRRSSWPSRVITTSDVAPWWKEWPYTLEEYPLNFKLFFPLYLPAPLLWTDDDMIVMQDPGFLLGKTPWGGNGGLDSLDHDDVLIPALQSMVGTCQSSEDFRATFEERRTDAGAYYLPTVARGAWERDLRRFFTAPAVEQLHARVGRVRRFVNPFRIMDQRFLSAYLVKHNGLRLRAPHYRMLPYKEPHRNTRLKDGVFTHYAASGKKMAYVEWFDELADERGLPK